jgi:hypothetical protein
LERAAKELFYPDRGWPLVLRRGRAAGVPDADLESLRAWLPGGCINQKRDDAVAMLRRMRADLTAAPGPKRVGYRFEHTIWWDHASRHAGSLPIGPEGGDTATLDGLLDELRLGGDAYFDAYERTALRRLAMLEASRLGYAPTPESVQQTVDEFRRARQLFTSDDVWRWLEESHLTRERFAQLMQDETLVQAVRNGLEKDVVERLPDQLRLSGSYRRLLERALEKQRTLAALGLDNPGLEDAGLTDEGLLVWYFARRGKPVPDPGGWLPQGDGFVDEDAFRRAALREFCFVRALERQVRGTAAS